MSKTIYIAGALFTPGQRSYLEKIDNLCTSSGFKTYLPHRDAGLFDRKTTPPDFFFNKDLEEIGKCDIVIAVLNGLEIDSGTMWEVGYAYSKSKIIIGLIEDTRIFNKTQQLNPMISGSVKKICSNLDELKATLSSFK